MENPWSFELPGTGVPGRTPNRIIRHFPIVSKVYRAETGYIFAGNLKKDIQRAIKVPAGYIYTICTTYCQAFFLKI
jgi:hypothetical protein